MRAYVFQQVKTIISGDGRFSSFFFFFLLRAAMSRLFSSIVYPAEKIEGDEKWKQVFPVPLREVFFSPLGIVELRGGKK